jgi:hypothetical protein
MLLASERGPDATDQQSGQQQIAALDQFLGSGPGANTLVLTDALLAAEWGNDPGGEQPGPYRITALDQLLGSNPEATTPLRQGENLEVV